MSDYFTNYLIKNQQGKVTFANKNPACFQEVMGFYSKYTSLLNTDGTFEIWILSGEIPLDNKDKSVRDYVKFINRNVHPCSVKFHNDIPLSGNEIFDTRISGRNKKGHTGIYIISLKLKAGYNTNSSFTKRLKIACHLLRFLYEANLYLCVKYFLSLKKIKKEIKSRVTDFTLLGYTYAYTSNIDGGARLWTGHTTRKTYYPTYTLKDSYLNTLPWDYTASQLFGADQPIPANTPKNLEEFNNFKNYLK